ncbi:MAG: hypothetical protein Q9174_006363 [Haloplaca sp. 1 TL-2023]
MDLLNSLLSGAAGGGAGGFSSAGSSFLDALTTAGSANVLSVADLGALSGQLDAIELTSFSGGQLTEIQSAQSALRSARDGLLKLIPGIRSTLSQPGPYAKTAFAGVLASLVANDVVMQALIYYEGSPTKASQAAKPPTAAPSASPSSEPREWIFNTVVGTSKEEFDKFIKSLPDKGSGRQIIYPSMNYQWYVTRMTKKEAMVVHRATIVDQLVPNQRLQSSLAFARGNASTTDKYLAPRAGPGALKLAQESQIDAARMQISWWRDRPVPGLYSNDPSWAYLHDESAGEGTFIYVFDTKINFDHHEFRLQKERGTPVSYIPKQLLRPDASDPTQYSDKGGHGTAVASRAAGKNLGVANKATIINVVIHGAEALPDWDLKDDMLCEAWEWASDDVKNHDRQGRAVFSMSMGFFYDPWRRPKAAEPRYASWGLAATSHDDYWLPLLVRAWELDIPTVVSSINKADDHDKQYYLGSYSPQRYGTKDNALITIGSLDEDGKIWSKDMAEGFHHQMIVDPQCFGHRDAFARSVGIIVADASRAVKQTAGASFAAPQAAGLIAYWRGLPEPHRPRWDKGKVALSAKRTLVERRRQASAGSPDRLGSIYSGIRELLCEFGSQDQDSPPTIKQRAQNMFQNATEAALREKLLATAVDDPVAQWSV